MQKLQNNVVRPDVFTEMLERRRGRKVLTDPDVRKRYDASLETDDATDDETAESISKPKLTPEGYEALRLRTVACVIELRRILFETVREDGTKPWHPYPRSAAPLLGQLDEFEMAIGSFIDRVEAAGDDEKDDD